MTLVVRRVFHCVFGKAKNVRSSGPPSYRLRATPGHRLAHLRSTASYAAVHDAKKVFAKLVERVLGRLALEVTELVDGHHRCDDAKVLSPMGFRWLTVGRNVSGGAGGSRVA